jgi:hypothetical protein
MKPLEQREAAEAAERLPVGGDPEDDAEAAERRREHRDATRQPGGERGGLGVNTGELIEAPRGGSVEPVLGGDVRQGRPQIHGSPLVAVVGCGPDSRAWPERGVETSGSLSRASRRPRAEFTPAPAKAPSPQERQRCSRSLRERERVRRERSFEAWAIAAPGPAAVDALRSRVKRLSAISSLAPDDVARSA